MLVVLFWSLIFIGSILILIKAADYFTESAEKVGLAFRIPSFIIGGTIVAFGTSLPELVSSVVATLNGASEIVIGSVVGSNITNIALILGIALLFIRRVHIDRDVIHVDLPILFGSSIFLGFASIDGVFNLTEALIFVAGIVLYILYLLKGEQHDDVPIEKDVKEGVTRGRITLKTLLTLVGSGVFIWLGARYTVESILTLSDILDIGSETLALFAVALGTSLPELSVTVSAVKKGKGEIAVGNILGSNIFNTFAVMGFSALFGSLVIPEQILFFYLPFMFVLTILFFLMAQDKSFARWEGLLLLLFYIFYLVKLAGI